MGRWGDGEMGRWGDGEMTGYRYTWCILWYACPMGTERVTVTLPKEQVEMIRQSTDNVSGFVAEAVADRLRLELIRADLRAYQAEHGEFTEEEGCTARQHLTPWTPELLDVA